MANFLNLGGRAATQPSGIIAEPVSSGGSMSEVPIAIDWTKPAYGSVALPDGRYYWCAFRRLRDWLEIASRSIPAMTRTSKTPTTLRAPLSVPTCENARRWRRCPSPG